MAYPSLDIILFGLFLALNLFIGLRAGRKVDTVQGFAMGNKDFSTGTVTSTIVATCIGGGFMFYGLQNTYTKGILFITPTLGIFLAFLLTGRVLAIRMGEFLNNLSVAEAMGDLYGKVVRVITAISGILGAIGYIAMQFQVTARVLSFMVGVEGPEVSIAAAAIVILYSAFGGIRAVVITDVLQFIVFSIFIPMLALVVWNHVQDPSKVTQVLTTNPIFSFKHVIGWNPDFLAALGLMFYFAIPGLPPAVFQRVTIARDVKQARDAFTYSAALVFLITQSVVFIGVLLLADDPHIEPSGLVNYIITTYTTPGLKALMGIGIMAMAMSSADSDLNVSAVLAVNDIVKPLKPGWKESMVVVRLFSFGIGVCALLLALYATDLLKLLLLSASFYMPIVTVPLLLAIFGFRSTPRAVLIGMGAGFITVLGWDKLFGNLGLDSLIPGMLANLVCLMGSHYALRQPGGWVGIKDKAPLLAARQARQEAWQNLVRTLKETKLSDYLQKNLPSHDVMYSLFGIYILGATYACFFTIPDNLVFQYQKLYDVAAHSVLVCTAVFLTYPAWPPTFRAKWFITYAWPIGICYTLFVVGIQLVIMSGFHDIQVMILLLNLVLAAMLLSWPLMLSVAVGGITIGFLVFQGYYGAIHLAGSSNSLQFNFVYGILLVSSFLIALFRFKREKETLADKHTYLEARHTHLQGHEQEMQQELLQARKHEEKFFKALDEEGIGELQKTVIEGNILAIQLEAAPTNWFVEEARNSVVHFTHRAKVLSQYLSTLVHRAASYIQLSVDTIQLDLLCKEIEHIVALQTTKPLTAVHILQHSKALTLECDIHQIKKLVINSIIYAQEQSVTTSHNLPITLAIEDTTLGYAMNSIKGHIKKIPALRLTITTAPQLPTLKPLYLSNPEEPNAISLQKENLTLFSNQQILEAHYGYSALDLGATYLTQVYVIPQQLRSIRPKEIDLPEMDTDVPIQPSDETYPGAAEQEAQFLSSLTLADTQGVTLIRKAIRLIKKFHGPVKRKSGEPFYLHPIAVAQIVTAYTMDLDTILAALLHDTVEDTAITLPQIELMFNADVRKLVDGVTHLDSIQKTIYRLKLSAHENIRQLLDMEDKRVLYVKLADRLHNMRTIAFHATDKQKVIAEETLQFFVPIAQYIDLMPVAAELKALSFEVLNQ